MAAPIIAVSGPSGAGKSTVARLLAQSFDRGERRRLAGFFGFVGTLHLLGWGLLLAYSASHPAFLALGGLVGLFFGPDIVDWYLDSFT